MRINEWPLSDRPREKFISRGAEALSDAELLAIVIRVGSRGKTALDVARALLQRYGTLRGVFKASVEELSTNYGVGKSVGVHDSHRVQPLDLARVQPQLLRELLQSRAISYLD